jgi:hypothetical protein
MEGNALAWDTPVLHRVLRSGNLSVNLPRQAVLNGLGHDGDFLQ